MVDILVIIAGTAISIVVVLTLSFFISSIREKESRASFYAGAQLQITWSVLIVFLYLNSIGFFDNGIGLWILIFILAAGIITALLLVLPIGANPKALDGTRGLIVGDVAQIDERATVFSRLVKERMDKAGQKFPPDNISGSRETPKASSTENLLAFGNIDGPGGIVNMAMTKASELVTRRLAAPEIISPGVSDERIEITPEDASKRIKGYARNIGAVLVGITELNPFWIYSHRGKSGIIQNEWGKEIHLDHKFAIVFGVEMDFDLTGASPHSPIMVASMTDYAKGAFIATQVAGFIANLGYVARANQMAHYDTMLVPLAIDAGLGELSRMGYLITKEFGPRVRLGAVTTTIPLVPDKPVDIGVLDFCRKCLKCAHCCPTRSIPLDDRKTVNGSIRWTIDTDTCHQYWRKLGTDCGICMRVCPWSHARTMPHRIITEAVTRSSFSRTMFNWMDDLFYGKKPPVKTPPEWTGFD